MRHVVPGTASRAIARARGARRVAVIAVLAMTTAGVSGCSTLRATVGSYAEGPAGIARPQHRLRQALTSGDFVTALAWREDDELLRALTRASSAYYAAQYQRASTLLDSAALIADDRMTASVSRNALALMTNDNARPYQTRRTERLFIAYYGMLSYAQMESWESAAVEARRVVALLAQFGVDRDPAERPLHATLGYLAGAVFERAGQVGEAQVAYRAAQQLLPSALQRADVPATGEGEVLVVLERGFVAHRVSEQINVFVGGDDEDADSVYGDGYEESPSLVRMVSHSVGAMSRGRRARDAGITAGDTVKRRRRVRDGDHHRDGDSWLAVALPTMRRSGRPWGDAVRFVTDSGSASALRIAATVDDAAAVDEGRDRVASMARAVVRATAKYAVTRAVKDKKGDAAGTLANYGVSLLERADVRSWHLLPQEVQLFRMRLPAGSRMMRLEVADASGPRIVELGQVMVRQGAVTIAPFRLWSERGTEAERVVSARR